MSQPDLFGRHFDPKPVSNLPDPVKIRERMEGILRELTESDRMPWSSKKLGLWRVIWPQMMRWLPAREHGDLRRRFDEQLARLAEN